MYVKYNGSNIYNTKGNLEITKGDIIKIYGKHIDKGYIVKTKDGTNYFWVSEEDIKLL